MVFDDPNDTLVGANLDYADFTGSTISNDLFTVASSKTGLVLDQVHYTYAGPILTGAPGDSIASAKDAYLVPLGGPVLVGNWHQGNYSTGNGDDDVSDPGALTGVDFSGTQFGMVINVDFEGANLAGAKFVEGRIESSSFKDANLTDAVIGSVTNGAATLGGGSFVGATVDGLTIASGGGGVNFMGIDMRTVTLGDGVQFGGTNIVGTVWDGMTIRLSGFGGASATGASFKNAKFTGGLVQMAAGADATGINFSGATFTNPDGTSDGAGLSMANAMMPGSDFTDASIPVLDLPSSAITGSDFTGATIHELNLNAVEANGIKMPGADIPIAAMASSNFTSADFSNSRIGYESDDRIWETSLLNFADLSGAEFMISGGTYWGTKAVGTDFTVSGRSVAPLIQSADFTNATFRMSATNPGDLISTRIEDSVMDGVVFDVNITDMSLVDSSAVGAQFNPDGGFPLLGLWADNTDFSDTVWPSVIDGESDRFLHNLRFVNSTLDGSDLAPQRYEILLSHVTSNVSFGLDAPAAWRNDQNADPFNADGSYFWGARIDSCTHDPQWSTFSIGTTNVTCEAAFDARTVEEPDDWTPVDFSQSMLGSGGVNSFWLNFVGDRGNSWTAPAPEPTPEDVFDRTEIPSGVLWKRSGAGYSTDSDIITYRGNTMSFDVVVNAPPAMYVTEAAAVVAGDEVPAETIGGWAVAYPKAVVTATGLPEGVTLCAGEVANPETYTRQWLCGVPTLGSAGVHTVTMTATNEFGTDSATIELSVNSAPTLTVTDAPELMVGQDVPAETIGGRAVAYPRAVVTATGLPDGVVVCPVDPDETGTTSRLWLCGAPAAGTGGEYAVTFTATNDVGSVSETIDLLISEEVVAVPEVPEVTDVPEPPVDSDVPELASTGVDGWVLPLVVLAIACLAVGGATVVNTRARRRGRE